MLVKAVEMLSVPSRLQNLTTQPASERTLAWTASPSPKENNNICLSDKCC